MNRIFFSFFLFTFLFINQCSSNSEPPPSPLSPARLPGDQDITVSTPQTILNRYASIPQDLTHGKTEIVIGADALKPLLPLTSGDLLFIMQMQGAEMISPLPNTDQYGTLMNPKGAGLFEFVRVSSVNENTGIINLDLQSGGLKNDYSALGKTQIVWVPQYNHFSLALGGSVVALPWDGNKGGIVAIQSQDVQILGNIDVTGQGFRGGGSNLATNNDTTMVTDYVSSTTAVGGEKGESVLGQIADYDMEGGRYGRGAPANGGGGGNSYKAGGGGGANGNNTQTWTGKGVMGAMYATAWVLDTTPAANSSGGGRGGYTSSTAMSNPTTLAPGQTTWGGNYRRDQGGLGGRPFPANPASRLTFGGGGGSAAPTGPLSQNGGSRGGNGGGLVYIISKNVHGVGQILANGTPGESSSSADVNQGGGGGGGGGTIIIRSPQSHELSLYAQGGTGGDQLGTNAEADGPGGGGGGGFIALDGASFVNQFVDGGKGGVSHSLSMNQIGQEFPPNGASSGASGEVDSPATFLPSADIQTSITTSTPGLPTPSNSVVYSLKIYNQGPDFATGVSVNGNFNPAYPDLSWTCQTENSDLAHCTIFSGGNPVMTQADIAPGSYVTLFITVPIPSYITQKTIPISFQGSASYASDMVTQNNIFSYDLSPPADVTISLIPDQIGFQNQKPILYTIPVENVGPYCAHNLDLEITLSPGLTLQGAEGEGFSCAMTSQNFHCTRPEMSVGDKSTLRIQVVPSSSISSYQVKAKMNTESFDPNEINNLGIDEASASGLKGTLAGKGCSLAPHSSSDGLFEIILLFGILRLYLGRKTRMSQQAFASEAK